MKMTPFIRKLESLLVPDPDGPPLNPVTASFIREAIKIENGDYLCSQCGRDQLLGADEEGDGGWWCLDCMDKWEVANGCHWEDGTPIKP